MRHIFVAATVLAMTFSATTTTVAAAPPAGGGSQAAVTAATPAPSATDTDTDTDTDVQRIYGSNRYATAAKVAEAWPSGVALAYVVSGENFPDALTAAARAGALDAPLLLTARASLPAATKQALDRLKPARIVVVGGTTAASDAVVQALQSHATNGSVTRLAGEDRYATGARIAAEYPTGVARAFLVGGEAYPDALASAALAGSDQAPLLLTRDDVLSPATADALRRLAPREVVVVGGPGTVSESAAQQAASFTTSKSYQRVAGDNRYKTAELVAKQFPVGVTPAYVASGADFPDALVGAALAGRRSVPLILTPPDHVDSGTRRAIDYQDAASMFVFGGPNTVSDSTMYALRKDPVQAVPGAVLFDANVASSGLSRYGWVENAHRIKVVNDPGPLGASRKVMRFEVHESDNQLSGNPRAQAETPRMFKEGSEIWAGFSTYFPTAWPDQLPAKTGNFVTLAEFFGPPYSGPSPLKLGMVAGQNKLSIQRNRNYSWDTPWEEGPIRKNTWSDWVIRERLSSDAAVGFVEVYRNTGDGWKVMPLFGKTRLYTSTIDSTNSAGAQYHKLAVYYSAGMNLPGPLVMYYADHKVATSFAAAAPRSYGAPPSSCYVGLAS